jgi:PiT family inorganic phosphate transporter
VGAGIGSAGAVHWDVLTNKVVLPMAVSPLIGLALGYLLMVAILWAFRRVVPALVNRRFRWAQGLSTAAMSYSHGTQDAQKTMGVITLALVTTGHLRSFHVPLWVILSAAGAMGLGTAVGGWRVIRTLGSRITILDPPRGFAAQSSASAVLLFSAYGYAIPVSSTHVITSSVMGVGATRRLSSVRWGVAREVILAWVLTIPGAALMGWLAYELAHAAVGR